MERGTNCVGVVPLACGPGTTCVGEEMEITCGTWILLGGGMAVWFSQCCALCCGI